MVDRLQGKVALVTGSGRGIGRGVALRFAKEGAVVGVFDISGDDVAESIRQIESVGGVGVSLVGDLREPQAVEEAVNTLVNTQGTVDVVVNNAAVMPAGTLHETSLEHWDALFAVNVRGAYLVNRAVIPVMLENGGGSIIHMASVTGILGLPGLAGYSATKGALISLTRAMSTDYASRGIRVNCVSPGTIDSPMLHNFLKEQPEQSRDRLRDEFDAMHPIGRVGQIDEVAQVCVFLASDDASFVTGANYTVDGGLSVKGTQPQD